MKQLLTRAELEAIGQNWQDRRDKLFEYARNKGNPYNKRMKAIALSAVLIMRLSRIIVALQQDKTRKQFPPGGIFSSTTLGEGEYIIMK